MSQLEFPQFDGTRHARLGYGDRCVLVLIEDSAYRVLPGHLVLDPATAKAMGKLLVEFAARSQEHDEGSSDSVVWVDSAGGQMLFPPADQRDGGHSEK